MFSLGGVFANRSLVREEMKEGNNQTTDNDSDHMELMRRRIINWQFHSRSSLKGSARIIRCVCPIIEHIPHEQLKNQERMDSMWPGKKMRDQKNCPECKEIIKGDAHSHGGRMEKERRSLGWTVNGEEDRA